MSREQPVEMARRGVERRVPRCWVDALIAVDDAGLPGVLTTGVGAAR